MYALWAEQAQISSPYKYFDNYDDLRASGVYNVYHPKEPKGAARGIVSTLPICCTHYAAASIRRWHGRA